MRMLWIWIPLVGGLVLGGCGSKQELELYEPDSVQVWRTVNEEERTERAANSPIVELQTTEGAIVLELFAEDAPESVENFLDYVRSGFYDGTIFHRVESGLVIQGGGYTREMERKETAEPIANEAGNGLRNRRGTVGVARTQAMDSGTSQFYINLVDNAGFDGDGESGGYAVFGRVYEGMDVVDRIGLVETGQSGGMRNVPVEPVVVESARVLQSGR